MWPSAHANGAFKTASVAGCCNAISINQPRKPINEIEIRRRSFDPRTGNRFTGDRQHASRQYGHLGGRGYSRTEGLGRRTGCHLHHPRPEGTRRRQGSRRQSHRFRYGYQFGPVLFKPTLTAAPQTFRTTRDGALAYFVGGDPNYPQGQRVRTEKLAQRGHRQCRHLHLRKYRNHHGQRHYHGQEWKSDHGRQDLEVRQGR